MANNSGIYCQVIKRLFDILISLCVILVFWWLFLVVAVLVRIKLGSPVIYKTKRAGRIDKKTGEERVFNLYKFRSMSNATDENGNLLPDTQRLTPFGRKIRALSIDEIPEFFNILKGDMSLIGPRPLPVSYIYYYTDEERHRHDVRPGLSGWAQVNGRNAISWDKKFEYDIEYVKNISLVMDLSIIFATVKKVLIKEGIGQGEQCPENLYDCRDKVR